VVNLIRSNRDLTRKEVRMKLSQMYPGGKDPGLDRSIDLAARLWLMINIREQRFQSLRPQTPCISWDEDLTLQRCIDRSFPGSRWKATAKESRLDPYFTPANMVRICGLEVQWTTSLENHLQLNRRHRVLQIFPYKRFLRTMLIEQSHRPSTEYVRGENN